MGCAGSKAAATEDKKPEENAEGGAGEQPQEEKKE